MSEHTGYLTYHTEDWFHQPKGCPRMRRRTAVAAVAVGTAFAMILTACGKSTTTPGTGASTASAAFNAAIGKVYNPSTKTGGTLRFANSGDWDSLDPADTYYGYSWNFIRLYGRALTMFKPVPGAASNEIIPDLAETLGVPSDNAKTWTYKIRKGVKFEDGTAVTSKDVKYAVERSLDKDTYPNGPTYFNDFLDLQGYTSPYKDSDPNKLGLKAIDTPDDQTIVFHLKTSFSGFDYFAQLPATIPVPQAKDTGSKYKEHVVSTGPYMFQTNDLGIRPGDDLIADLHGLAGRRLVRNGYQADQVRQFIAQASGMPQDVAEPRPAQMRRRSDGGSFGRRSGCWAAAGLAQSFGEALHLFLGPDDLFER